MVTKEIKLKLHEESDLYSSYDPDQKLLSEDVAIYLTHNYLNKHRKNDEKYILRIISDTPVNQENAKENIQKHTWHENC